MKQVTSNGLLQSVNYDFNLLENVGGNTFYVDGNLGSDTNTGKSWEDAFKTLSVALAASHADIASGAFGWTARNRIYLKDDEVTENLVKLADKTDVIGVGSYDRNLGARIKGNHAPVGAYMGTRFINCHFLVPDAGGDIFTLPTTVSGISFLGCCFDGVNTAGATGAIITTSVESLEVQRCKFVGAFSDAVIEIGGTENNGLLIADNTIMGANDGVELKSTVTATVRPMFITGNRINTTTICINDASGKAYIEDNRCITANAKGAAGAGAIVGGAKMMLQNYISTSDVANAIVPANGSL